MLLRATVPPPLVCSRPRLAAPMALCAPSAAASAEASRTSPEASRVAARRTPSPRRTVCPASPTPARTVSPARSTPARTPSRELASACSEHWQDEAMACLPMGMQRCTITWWGMYLRLMVFLRPTSAHPMHMRTSPKPIQPRLSAGTYSCSRKRMSPPSTEVAVTHPYSTGSSREAGKWSRPLRSHQMAAIDRTVHARQMAQKAK
mmetsp:Transcript_2688/g.8987  ORF Transcript_2688/g.8987 Transcript_2688/m.8987 type:complete len:205 (-) Transcript_2688:1646-2260(-)